MQLQQDTLFDNRYLLIKLLGYGGFSEVWLVEDVKVGHKKMALKIYVPDKGLDDDGVRIFSCEFELVFDLNHTNLLRPAHFDVCERSPYLVMPYCEQGSANKLVGQLNEEDAWQFLHDVAAGLAFLHAQNPPIIHQDIKPDNVLKDNLGHYLITDFGISTKVRSTLRKSMAETKSGGTMAYMPPERFGKDNVPIKASDIWATGVTLYELLAGDIPFGEQGGLMQKSGADIPNIPGSWSKEMQEIIQRCLQREPWDRPIAQQLVEWTDNHFKGEKIVFDKKTMKLPSKKTLFVIGGSVVGLLLALIIVSYFKHRTPEKETKNTDLVDNTINQLLLDTVAVSLYELPVDTISSVAVDSTADISVQPESVAPASQTRPAAATPPAWLTTYNRIIKQAQSAYSKRDYTLAKQEYDKALNLANQNGDRQKVTFVNEKITECNHAIEAANKASEEAHLKEIQERLASYNFVGNFALGTDFLIVQRKADNKWGIIRKDGKEAEAFNYSQVSMRLKNGFFALKNDEGWVVFDTSMKKLKTGLDKLDGYR